jgi:peroxisomal 3,2-trans-enoyl-CoA isomerase
VYQHIPSGEYSSIFDVVYKPMHHRKRKLVGQAISERSMRIFHPAMVKQVNIFLDILASSSCKLVNMTDRLKRLGMDIIGLLALAYPLDTQFQDKYRFLIQAHAFGVFRSNIYLHYPFVKATGVYNLLERLATADVQPPMEQMLSRSYWLPKLVNNNLDVARAFYAHIKILVTALNGPVIGLSAALISHSDFVYSVPDAYVLTPFSSLGLVAEGGASVAFMQRMGWGKANEALILGRKIPVQELVQVGFVSKLFQDKANFRQQVLEHVQATFGDHVVGSSMLGTKALLCRRLVHEQDEAAPLETFGGLDRFWEGITQTEMAKVASGSNKHRLE